MNKKKILIVIATINPGGAERQVITDARLLTDAGFKVTIAFHMDGPLRVQIDSRVETFRIGSKNEFKAGRILRKFIKKNKFEAIFAHMFWAHKVTAIATFGKKQNLYFFDHGLGLWRKSHHLLVVKLTTMRAGKVVTASGAKKKIKIEREGIREDKVMVMHNCYNKAEIDPTPVDRLPFKKDRFVIGFAGRFNAVKQLPLLVDVAKIMRDKSDQFVFVLMGDGNEREKIEKLVKDNKLQNHFVFPGFINRPLSVMAHFDVFILPSKREDFSVALLEAGAVGLPALAFDVGGNKEIIVDGETGFVIPPYDEKVLAEKLLYLMENKAVKEKMGKIASERVQSTFSEKKRQENLVNLISSES